MVGILLELVVVWESGVGLWRGVVSSGVTAARVVELSTSPS
jgi:hypothetical protein